MRLGQTSLIVFLSNTIGSVIGFVATLYIARQLGPTPLGIYHLVIGLVSWLAIVGEIGISGAVTKRVSEGEERIEFATAATILIGMLFGVVALGIVLFHTRLNEYVGYPAASFIVLILGAALAYSIVSSLLSGLHLVHVGAILSPIKTGTRSLLQVVAVFSGLTVAGLFWGHLGGTVLVVVLGGIIVIRKLRPFTLPNERHFRSLFDFAKFAWLGGLRSQMFSYTDIIVLGFFVPSALIGVYAIAWNIAQFLVIFSSAISSTLFPAMSKVSAQRDPQAAADMIERSLTYGGLILVPGVFGSALLGERILRIYGSEFTQGAVILFVLVIANLFMGYQNQLLNALNAIDRPDLSFRVNAVFVGVNLLLNVALIYLYGWFGAAVATAASVAVSLCVAHYLLSGAVTFDVPLEEIGLQVVAAIVMAVVVYASLTAESVYQIINHNFATVLVIVSTGALTYFLTLMALSTQFRATVRRNLPSLDPYLPG